VESLPENSIDAFFEEPLTQQKKNEELFLKNNYLLHKVFVQNEDGAKLLSKWRNSLMMTPTLDGQCSQFEAGLNEGEKRFIRNLITQSEAVEKEL
jgi:hypothetical protein